MPNMLTRLFDPKTPGRPTREARILADECNKKRKKKKILSEISDSLTIFAQGDARKKKKRKNWDY